jgi:hypothetical protein
MTQHKDNEHLDEEILGSLVAGTLSEGTRARAMDHVVACPECLSAYTDLVELGSERDRAPDRFRVTADRAHFYGQMSTRDATGARRRPRGRWLAVAATLAVLVPAIFLLARGDRLESGYWDPIRAQLGVESSAELIYPEIAGIITPEGPAYRNRTGSGPGVAEATEEARQRFLENETPESGFWYSAGLISQGHLDRVSPVLYGLRSRFPDDPRILQLSAILAYRQNDLEAARDLLMKVPGDPAARFNLAYVLAELGDVEAAHSVLTDLLTSSPPDFISERALTVLDSR